MPNKNSQEFHHEELDYFLQQLRESEREVLPNKKRRALEVAEADLERQKKEKNGFQTLIRDILAHFDFSPDTGIVEDMTVDFERFAELWLELLSPQLIALKTKLRIKNRQLLSLEDLKKPRYLKGFTQEELTWLHNNIPLTEKLDYRVAACVVGGEGKDLIPDIFLLIGTFNINLN